ncbi:MAG: hypothetical protein NUV53_01740, partial [Patescibacteria group bacterium]|nr:hypothetical protein [Patescibacteria group bacterium]
VDNAGRIYRYGEFFPAEISPFAYNETIAQEYFSLSREEACVAGFAWKEPEVREYAVSRTAEDLASHIEDVEDAITKEIIGCAHRGVCNHQCATAFKIIPEELSFYRRMRLSLPQLCPNCRHYERLAQRNPLKLWHRRCQCSGAKNENKPAYRSGRYKNISSHFHGDAQCPNEFETPYAPERKEIVYCEGCYQGEVA